MRVDDALRVVQDKTQNLSLFLLALDGKMKAVLRELGMAIDRDRVVVVFALSKKTN